MAKKQETPSTIPSVMDLPRNPPSLTSSMPQSYVSQPYYPFNPYPCAQYGMPAAGVYYNSHYYYGQAPAHLQPTQGYYPPIPSPFSVPPPSLPPQAKSSSASASSAPRDERCRDKSPSGREKNHYSSYRRHDRDSGRPRERDKRYERRERSRNSPVSDGPQPNLLRRSSYPSPSPSSSTRRSPFVSDQRQETPSKRTSYFSDDRFDRNKRFLEKRADMKIEDIIAQEKQVWTRSAPADLYYQRDPNNPLTMKATPKLTELCDKFEEKIIRETEDARKQFPSYEPLRLPRRIRRCRGSACNGAGNCKKRIKNTSKTSVKKKLGDSTSSSSSGSSDSSSSEDDDKESKKYSNESVKWLEHRQKQSYRLHNELWDNQKGESNDGPTCRCSNKAKKVGIRHGIYQGETSDHNLDVNSNNFEKLYHYRITISPPTNFLIKNPTVIQHDGHEFIFEGFSLFSPKRLNDIPICNVLRFNIRYSIFIIEEKVPDNFTVRELKLFQQYFFYDLLELLDWDVNEQFYFMPRFVRDLTENGKEILSMNEIMRYLLESRRPIVDAPELHHMISMSAPEWLAFVDQVKGMLVTKPGMKPAAIRVDQIDREQEDEHVIKYPDIVHFGMRPPQLCYAGNAEYQRVWREYVKFRHLLANMAKPSFKDRRTLEEMEEKLSEMRGSSNMKRDVTIALSCEGFFRTGLMADIVQHGLLLPVLVNHLRLHASLKFLEEKIGYNFQNRQLLQLAMTHPSYKENFGTTPDHARNTLSACGIRQPEYGDKRVHFANSRKRGINMLINIMSRFGRRSETESSVQHNERLEFLGDAVVEFITSVHLFHMFPDLEEGGLATFRAALVQNQHLAILAETLGLENYMLYAHGSDLCHDSEMRHAMANCFEALMGAIYLDGGINHADRVFAEALFGSESELHETWIKLPHHPLQLQEPGGDRHWIKTYPLLQKLTKFEETIGIEFTHIRILARAFTDRSLGMSNLTLGSNQRLEFLGDTVLQLVTSDYLYRHFPEHHEGHLSLLRSSIVNNRTQSVVCDDLGMTAYAAYANPKHDLKIKDKADLLEAFLGALYVDKDLEYCQKFAEVCFFPRLNQFIVNQEWNDPKSKLQQCCLTLRTMNGREPDIPVYKVTDSKGPTNTRIYGVVVYFRNERLAKAQGHSIQEAEMNAAKLALETRSDLFPHLNYQKKIVERSFKRQSKEQQKQAWLVEVRQKRKELGLDNAEPPRNRPSSSASSTREYNHPDASQSSPAPAKKPRNDEKSKRREDKRATQLPVVMKKKANENEPKEEGECSDDDEVVDEA